MFNTNIYDPNEELPSPSQDVIYQLLNSPSIFDLNNAATPAGMIPSNTSSLSSPPRSATCSDTLPFNDFGSYEFQPTLSFNNLGTTFPNNDFQTTIMNNDPESSFPDIDVLYNPFLKQDGGKLRIIAEPKALYRERYPCEIDPKKNRAQRFIRTEDGNNKHEHPTVKIPEQMRDPSRQLYIRVTLVTVLSENIPVPCIHPYVIDTPEENNVMRDPDHNSLYFRINNEEFHTGEKSFRITRKKMIQHDLKTYGPWRLFDSNENDIQRVQNPSDAKQLIATYQLWKSQLVFTMAERQDNKLLPLSIPQTSVKSQIMIDEASDKRNGSMNDSDNTNIYNIKCIPQKGDWQGGDEVLLVLPNRIKRKVYYISFDFGPLGQKTINEMTYIDTKTILFRTPPYPRSPSDNNITVSIIIKSKDSIQAQIDFHYLTPIKTNNICRNCQIVMTNINISNKRRYDLIYNYETDGGESLISEMSQLLTEQKPATTCSRISSTSASDDKESKFDKYLNQLKDSVVDFVRTNNPSRLFRRTRLLLAKCNEKPPPLNDAIQRGHTDLALSLIEQVIAMRAPNGLLEKESDHGETPLLIAAKVNQWKLIEAILSKRSDLAQQKDNEGNNLLHLLANLSEDDKVAETMKNVLGILPNDVKGNLLKEQNENNQTAMEIAQSRGNTQCMELFQCLVNVGKNNI